MGRSRANRFYGETADTALGALARLAPIVETLDPWALEDAEAELNRALRFNGSVKAAISAAMHDLAGKRLGVPVYKMWGLDPARAPLSSFTIAIASSADELRTRVAQAESYPVLKIKLAPITTRT
jgi:L-alanine-DL-glutamate epimerase-like enolase superfamily enzyme